MERMGEPISQPKHNPEKQQGSDEEINHNYELLKAALEMPSGVVAVSERARELEQSPLAGSDQGMRISRSRLDTIASLRDQAWSISSRAATQIAELLQSITHRIGHSENRQASSNSSQIYTITSSLSSE